MTAWRRTTDDELRLVLHWAELMVGCWPDLRCLQQLAPAQPPRIRTTTLDPGAVDRAPWQLPPGTPLLFLPATRDPWHGLYVLVLAPDAPVRAEQQVYLNALAARGYRTAVCRGWVQARSIIIRYLAGPVRSGPPPPAITNRPELGECNEREYATENHRRRDAGGRGDPHRGPAADRFAAGAGV